MVINLTEIEFFGMLVNEKDVFKIKESMDLTYNNLIEQDEKWSDVEFSKREIGVLYEAIVDSFFIFLKDFHIDYNLQN